MKLITKLSLVILLLLLVACDNSGNSLSFMRPNDVTLAFGDSLTVGVGTRPELSYPAQLSRLISRKVVNGGISGETSAEGASRLPALLDKVEPELLLICHGGNDILQKLDREQLRTNLRRMYEAANQRGVKVILIAVPQFGLSLKDVALYQELATELDIPLVSGILTGLLANSQYRSDDIHLNDKGYRMLAEAIADLLAERGAI
ncbi:MAG: arylesterase [Desulfuromonadales bacterium]|nr:arylesterase [Desulfuromonadales bacterium]